MSHSLARLREIFGDPLFVPSGRLMAPTSLAERLASELSMALDHLGRAIAVPTSFVALTSRRVFRLATFDYFEVTALRDVLAYLEKHAPHVSLEIERFSPAVMPRLVSGEIDLALLGGASALPLAGLHVGADRRLTLRLRVHGSTWRRRSRARALPARRAPPSARRAQRSGRRTMVATHRRRRRRPLVS